MLKIVKPLTITDATLSLHSEAEDDYAAWSAVTTYAAGDHVVYAHRIMLSLQGTNLNHTPVGDSTDTWWFDVGPTNAWAMFDGAVNSVTTAAGTMLQVTITPTTRVNTVALVNATGTTARVTMTVDGSEVYSQEKTMNPGVAGSWYRWFFGDRTSAYTGDILFYDLPPYTGAPIMIELDAADVASCGFLILGQAVEIGTTETGAEVEFVDYSIKSTDAFGVSTLTERAYANRPTFPVFIEHSDLARVSRYLASIRATPCLFIGADDGANSFSLLTTVGWIKSFRTVVEYPTHSRASITVEGLI